MRTYKKTEYMFGKADAVHTELCNQGQHVQIQFTSIIDMYSEEVFHVKLDLEHARFLLKFLTKDIAGI